MKSPAIGRKKENLLGKRRQLIVYEIASLSGFTLIYTPVVCV
jgi:hypothetical protein